MYLTIEIVRQSSAVMRGIDFSKNKTRETENVFMTDRLINIYIKRGYGRIGECVGLLLLLLLLFSSCTDESISNGIHTDTGDSTRVNLTFDLQQQTTLTRTLSSSGTSESQVDNINVLIFDNNSKLIGSDYESFGTSKTASFSVSVPTRVASGCTIYAVANLPSDSLRNVATISDFKKKFTLMSSTATLGNGSNMVMFGQTSNVTISATVASNTPSIILTRLGSKVTFNIKPATGITITGYQLCHVPMSSYLTNATDSTYFNPRTTYGDFTSVSGLSSTTQVSPYYYMYENLVGRKSGATSFFSRSQANAPTDASYLLIYASRADEDWTATYRIYLGGTGMSDYLNYSIPRNYNYTYNINIDGADNVDVRVTATTTIHIGDYYYSDGTCGTVASPVGKTVIGIVFSTRISSQEQAKGYTHGYVVALNDASTSSTWGPISDSSLPNFSDLGADYTDLSSGYNAVTTYSMANSTYPAFNVATNYAYGAVSAGTHPSSASAWYLPTMGQLIDLAANLGGIDISSVKSGGSNVSGTGLSLGSSTNITQINGYFTAAGGTVLNASDVYWSSSESADGTAGRVRFDPSVFSLNSIADKSLPIYVRAVLAF